LIAYLLLNNPVSLYFYIIKYHRIIAGCSTNSQDNPKVKLLDAMPGIIRLIQFGRMGKFFGTIYTATSILIIRKPPDETKNN
jgi:hypothetical protein